MVSLKRISLKRVSFFKLILISLMIVVVIILIKSKPTQISLYDCHFLMNNQSVKEGEPIFGDNITGYGKNIVPNIVHYVLFDINSISFVHYISILSLLRNQKPDSIIIHCNCNQLHGEYWKKVLLRKNHTQIFVREINKPTSIFGIPLSKDWLNWHASDIVRNRILAHFGGIYLDRDVYVVNSLDVFRKFEMTLDWDEGQFLGNQILIAHKNARFLNLYYETYQNYDASKWYYNAGELPTKQILYKYPQLVHRVKKWFGVDGPNVCSLLYTYNYLNWQYNYYAIHLYIRGNEMVHKWCLGNNKAHTLYFNEENVKKLNVTFGSMARLVLYDTTDFI